MRPASIKITAVTCGVDPWSWSREFPSGRPGRQWRFCPWEYSGRQPQFLHRKFVSVSALRRALLWISHPERKQLSNASITQVEPKPREHRRSERDQRRIQCPESNVGCDLRHPDNPVRRTTPRTDVRGIKYNTIAPSWSEAINGKIFHLPADASPTRARTWIFSQFPSGTYQNDENRQKRNDATGPYHPAFPLASSFAGSETITPVCRM